MRPILSLGLTLIEVLFSLLFLSLVLLGVDVLTLSSWKLNLNAYYASLAQAQLSSLEQGLRFAGPGGSAEARFQAWQGENRLLLPQAQSTLQGEYPHYQVHLSWQGNQIDEEVNL